MEKMELLSPAGDMEAIKASFLYGADAVYVGGEGFGLRANAVFGAQELATAAEYAHRLNKKIYLTCNVVANNSDIDAFTEFIRNIAALKPMVDAVIVSDLGIFDLVKKNTDLPIHISTQAGVMNYATANMLHGLGAKRIILARETTLSDIKKIRLNTSRELEIEAFVHGAMCMAFSGRCLISTYLANRDANRGQCAQPCRWKYYLMEETRPGEFFKVDEDCDGTYIFNSMDLSMLEHIAELAQSGVSTFKIEGRAKTAYYSAVITNAYRVAIDSYIKGEVVPEWVKREVNCVSHRPYCTGFYLGESRENLQSCENSGYIRDCDFVGVVEKHCEGNLVEITQRNYFTTQDFLEVISPGKPPVKLDIEYMKNSKDEIVTVANHAVEVLYVKCDNVDFSVGSMIRRVNHSL